MSLSYEISLRNDLLDLISLEIDKGAGAGHVHFYDGVKPVGGGAETTMLVELVMSVNSFAAASGGSMTANPITSANAIATGTATWFRIDDSAEDYVIDGTVGLAGSGADLILDNVDLILGALVELDELIITEGNP